MDKCKDCGCTRLVQTDSDLTCTSCGLEQGLGNMVADYDFTQHSEVFEPFVVREYSNKVRFGDAVQTCLALPDEIFHTARDMYLAVTKDTEVGVTVKGELRNMELLTACCYYALGRQRSIQDLITSTSVLGISQLSWACKLAHSVLVKHPGYSGILLPKQVKQRQTISIMMQNTNFNVYLNKLAKACGWHEQEYRQVRGCYHKLLDKLDNIATLTLSIRPDKLVGALIYMACMFSKVKKVKLNVVSSCCSTTDATVLKGEDWIKQQLSRGVPV